MLINDKHLIQAIEKSAEEMTAAIQDHGLLSWEGTAGIGGLAALDLLVHNLHAIANPDNLSHDDYMRHFGRVADDDMLDNISTLLERLLNTNADNN